jgi:diaminopimelate decarboxylase
MPERFLEDVDLESLARRAGTPFHVYSADVLRRRIGEVRRVAPGGVVQPRYAMKACSARRVLEEVRGAGIWIDAVSGNEVLRARGAGFPMGGEPPVVMLTADVFRDNALDVALREGVLPNVGSPAMIGALSAAGYRGGIGLRLNPGFGHGHVSACDTGGPSSKHGIWHQEASEVRAAAERAGLPVRLLHAHVGSGPAIDEFFANMNRLVAFFGDLLEEYPHVEAVNLGGGIPHSYRTEAPAVDLSPLGRILAESQAELSRRAARAIRVEIEPGRYIIAPSGALVTRVTDVKRTRENERGRGHTFVMVDAGFVDLVRPAMYGSFHHISVHGVSPTARLEPLVVAGPLCESGDVFTRDADELLDPRPLPLPKIGDLVVLHDTGAYGAQMSSFYNSIGRAPQVWLDEGRAFLVSRRDTIEDITRNECFEPL